MIGIFKKLYAKSLRSTTSPTTDKILAISEEGEIVKLLTADNTLRTINYTISATNIATGTVTAFTTSSITDSTKTWTANQFADMVIRIVDPVEAKTDYGLVLSNNNNTLTFDKTLSFTPNTSCTYKVLETKVLVPENLPAICAFDVRLNDAALVLPESTPEIERRQVHVYIERANNGDHKVAVMARGTQTVGANKYFTLEHNQEGASVYPHMFVTPHHDIISTNNIKRYATCVFTGTEEITSATWSTIGLGTVYTCDNKKRFVDVVTSNYRWLRYNSLFERTFNVKLYIAIIKTGGGTSNVDISIAKKDGTTGVVTNLTTRLGSAREASDGRTTISASIPVTLKYNDEIALIGQRSSATVTIQVGSHVEIKEL